MRNESTNYQNPDLVNKMPLLVTGQGIRANNAREHSSSITISAHIIKDTCTMIFIYSLVLFIMISSYISQKKLKQDRCALELHELIAG